MRQVTPEPDKTLNSLQQWLSSLRELIKTEVDVRKREELKQESEAIQQQIDKEQKRFLISRNVSIHIIGKEDFI